MWAVTAGTYVHVHAGLAVVASFPGYSAGPCILVLITCTHWSCIYTCTCIWQYQRYGILVWDLLKSTCSFGRKGLTLVLLKEKWGWGTFPCLSLSSLRRNWLAATHRRCIWDYSAGRHQSNCMLHYLYCIMPHFSRYKIFADRAKITFPEINFAGHEACVYVSAHEHEATILWTQISRLESKLCTAKIWRCMVWYVVDAHTVFHTIRVQSAFLTLQNRECYGCVHVHIKRSAIITDCGVMPSHDTNGSN